MTWCCGLVNWAVCAHLKGSVACETTQCTELKQHWTSTCCTCVLLTACPRHVMLHTISQVHLTHIRHAITVNWHSHLMHLHCSGSYEDKQLSTRCTLLQQNKEWEKQLQAFLNRHCFKLCDCHWKMLLLIEKGYIYWQQITELKVSK